MYGNCCNNVQMGAFCTPLKYTLLYGNYFILGKYMYTSNPLKYTLLYGNMDRYVDYINILKSLKYTLLYGNWNIGNI